MTSIERPARHQALPEVPPVRTWTTTRPDGVTVHHWHHDAPASRPAPTANTVTTGAAVATFTIVLMFVTALVGAGAMTGATSGAVAGAVCLGLVGILFGIAALIVWSSR
jgi:hypothetical protein